ncbi:hypothetical protein B0J12DRAFT_533746, partial [Macrophomina phaseolina]
DSIINNACIYTEAANPAPIDESSEKSFNHHLQIDTKGAQHGCKYASQQMKEYELEKCGMRGWILNVASIGSLIGIPGILNYSGSKGAIISLAKTVSAEGGQFGIICNAICPG